MYNTRGIFGGNGSRGLKGSSGFDTRGGSTIESLSYSFICSHFLRVQQIPRQRGSAGTADPDRETERRGLHKARQKGELSEDPELGRRTAVMRAGINAEERRHLSAGVTDPQNPLCRSGVKVRPEYDVATVVFR